MPAKVVDEFERLKKDSSSRLVLKVINGKYYVYKEKGVWLRNLHKNKTLSEYLGRITDEGAFIKKALHARNDLESAKALVEQHGGEIIWHKKEAEESTNNAQNLSADVVDLSILMSLSMNSRMPVPRIAKLAGINEQTAYARIKSLERRFGIRYILEIDTAALGFTTYLILVKFDGGVPPVEEMKKAFSSEPRVQFAAITKGEYDVLAYLLDEDSVKAEDNLWKIMSETSLSRYNARWHMVPFGQVYSFVPLRQEFVDKILGQRQWHRRRFVVITPTQEDILKREYLLLTELNENAAMGFSEIDKKHGLGRGASRYTYQQLKTEGIITRPTITMYGIPLKYLGIMSVETENPKKVSETKHNLLHNELVYGNMMNKYALIGNTSMPEGSVLFIPVMTDGELEAAAQYMESGVKGIAIKTMIVSTILTGSLCYRRFDNNYSRQHATLIRLKKAEPGNLIEYDEMPM